MTILTNFGNWGNYVKLVMIEHELKTPIEASNKTGTGVFLNQICKEVMVKVNGHNYVAGEMNPVRFSFRKERGRKWSLRK